MLDLYDLTSRHILITGASSGLGQHAAHLFSSRGANLTLAARRGDRLDALARELRTIRQTSRFNAIADDLCAHNAQICVVEMDVCNEESVANGFAASIKSLGVPDVVLNNAGVAHTASALKTEKSDWERVMDTNLKGVWFVAREAALRMTEAQIKGSIINVASILGMRVAGGVSAYATSKAAVIQLTKSLALEWARHDIRVNALAPGYMETELNREFFATAAGKELIKRVPQRRLGNLSELDGPMLLLASDTSSYMTGSIIAVDGGHLVSSL
ncbi:MAG: 2-deoxy-D-gluconate 3-dehydrogenase [Cycloclasticus sp.]|nr:MAG: 2-deoxy-D-gluconate 3-dehydrogenase [Cycloclasticus sp.]